MFYAEATTGYSYSPGDFFVKIWNAQAYQDAAAMPEDEWVDGEENVASPPGQARKSDTNAVDDDEDRPRHLHGPGGSGVKVPRVQGSQWVSSLGSESRSRRDGNRT